jgi:hypothetical protein
MRGTGPNANGSVEGADVILTVSARAGATRFGFGSGPIPGFRRLPTLTRLTPLSWQSPAVVRDPRLLDAIIWWRSSSSPR